MCVKGWSTYVLKWDLGRFLSRTRWKFARVPGGSGTSAILAGYIRNVPTSWPSDRPRAPRGPFLKKLVVRLVSAYIILLEEGTPILCGLLVSLGLSVSCRPGEERQSGVKTRSVVADNESGKL